MFKRPRDIFDSPVSSSPPVKRARTSFTSSSPFAGSSSPAYLCTPYQPPSDSPSNPLGFNRTVAALQLPCETSFSKHLSLRFQLVLSGGGSHDDSPKGKGKAKMTSRERMQDAGEGVYRVVQVPRNYTFRHLHQLIFFLFASDARLSSLSSLSRTRRRSTRLTEMPALRAQAKARQSRFGSKRKADLEDGPDTGASQDVFTAATPGHVFDVLDGVGMYHSAYRPGVVKRGTGSTRVRLSSVRDRSLFPDVFEREQDRVLLQHAGSTAEVEEDVFGPVKGAMSQETMATAEDEEDRREWSWEPEGDFMVGDVWSGEPDPKKAIIYHHARTTAVHITLDTKTARPQKGAGNHPLVLRARGAAPPHALRTADLRPTRGVPPAAEEEDAALSDVGRLRAWNAHGAFARFLWRDAGAAMHAPPDPDLYVVEASPMPTSSPARPLALSHAGSSPMSVFRASSVVSARSAVREYDLGFDALPEDTPQPKRAAHRRRVARTSERLERLTESGLAALSDEDTDKEVDELAGDDGREKKPDEEAAKVEADKDAQKQKEEQVKEVVEWEEEEEEIDQLKDDDWDPFGDGEELDW